MSPDVIQQAAMILGRARLDNAGVSLPEKLAPGGEDAAYRLQESLHEWLGENGQGQRCGYKIGCTAPTMQEMLGVPHPAFGGVLKENIHRDEATFNIADFQLVGVECEIAFRLSSDLAADGALFSRSDVQAAIGSCMAAIEIVDNRYGDFLNTPAPVMMADDFFHSACVLGPEIKDWQGIEFDQIEGRTFVNGRLVESGQGSVILGHPLEAVVWLANRLAGLGRGLKAGEFILTGTLAGVQWIDPAPADTVISIDALGDVRASFV